MKSSKSARHADILAQITEQPSLRVADLAERMGVSTETIRRDLDELTRRRLINRTYGGAVRAPGAEPAIGQRHGLFVAERERIARTASARVTPGALLMIGSGATTTHVARRIAAEHKGLTVLTHSFAVATVLAINPTITVIMAPGAYLASEGATVGALTTRFFNEFSADLAIVGASGLTEEGATDALLEPAAVYGAIASRAATTMVVADRSKFDQMFPARYATWRELGVLVTDAPPSGALAAALERRQVEVALA
ncbi:DeoR family transcriptional regulator [Methylopila jiangsuensis]|uniref:DeoR family transcriptional regulator n=1 Tax=Methylopila jiangsuensis TaxID=586230 RepID=A0A9W6JLA8_9HYPH|nr:DeoR/GlpR family DNA-binding transcription regulator [Methylopila jiangsuensis]MDR6284815.1 DeoR/GlpR family transcriptional regulator of sugar metabolism [Methylopila jiangsuensis]GLK77794.1 DeoR family transcriptional regulator [Methylopila jiangsuensis]